MLSTLCRSQIPSKLQCSVSMRITASFEDYSVDMPVNRALSVPYSSNRGFFFTVSCLLQSRYVRAMPLLLLPCIRCELSQHYAMETVGLRFQVPGQGYRTEALPNRTDAVAAPGLIGHGLQQRGCCQSTTSRRNVQEAQQGAARETRQDGSGHVSAELRLRAATASAMGGVAAAEMQVQWRG